MLIEFYRKSGRLAGGRPIRNRSGLTPKSCKTLAKAHRFAVVNRACWPASRSSEPIVAPMYLVGHWHTYALAWCMVAVMAP